MRIHLTKEQLDFIDWNHRTQPPKVSRESPTLYELTVIRLKRSTTWPSAVQISCDVLSKLRMRQSRHAPLSDRR